MSMLGSHSRAALFVCALLPVAFAARSAEPREGAGSPGDAAGRWSLGVAGFANSGLRVGEDVNRLQVPMIGYEGDRVFLRGISAGVHLLDSEAIQIDAFVAMRFDGWAADDLSADGLAARGIDIASLEDRDDGVDAGVSMAWQALGGEFGAEMTADVSGASNGYAARIEYGVPFELAGGTLSPFFQVSYASAALSNYYFGTRPAEEAVGVTRYRPNATFTPGVGVRWARESANRWSFAAAIQVDRLDAAVTASPLVDEEANVQIAALLSVSRRFGD